MDRRTDGDWHKAAEAYLSAKHALEDAKQAEAEARQHLLELTDTDACGFGVSVKFSERKGGIDYKKVVAENLPDLDLSEYQKPSVSVQTIKVES